MIDWPVIVQVGSITPARKPRLCYWRDSHLFQKLVHELDGYRSFANGGSDGLDGTGAHVPGGEHAGPARLE